MKRDLDLIRAILVTAENADGPIGGGVLLSIEPDARKVAYHLELMQAHGLIRAAVKYDGLNETPCMLELASVTWEGYDYLDAIRSPKVWEKAKEAVSSAVGEASMSVMKDTCQAVARGMITSYLGM